MSKRERMLGAIVGVTLVLGGGLKYGYPAIHQFLFAVGEENERLEEELVELSAQLDEIEPVRKAYGDLIARTGTTDVDKVRNDFHARLASMIDATGLSDPRISPRRTTDRKPPRRSKSKTSIPMVRYSVTAEGKLESVVKFLKSFYELPYLAWITDLKIDPPSGRAKKNKNASVKLTTSIEVLVAPAHPVAEINPELLKPVEKNVKHTDQEYTIIASRSPFDEWVPPPPPPPPKPKSKPKPDPPKQVVKNDPKPPPPPPPPPKPKGDPQRNDKVVRMALSYGIDEVLVVNTKSKSSEYVPVGGMLDGGKVLLVHPLGAAARREDGTTNVYPVGRKLAECIPAEEADVDYPEIAYVLAELDKTGNEAADGEEPVEMGPHPEPKSAGAKGGPTSDSDAKKDVFDLLNKMRQDGKSSDKSASKAENTDRKKPEARRTPARERRRRDGATKTPPVNNNKASRTKPTTEEKPGEPSEKAADDKSGKSPPRKKQDEKGKQNDKDSDGGDSKEKGDTR